MRRPPDPRRVAAPGWEPEAGDQSTDLADRHPQNTKVEHPAQWSAAILEALELILVELALPVHDPFGGTGVRLGALCAGVRSGRQAEARHFAIADRCVPHWPVHAAVNVSDFYVAGQRYPLVQRWRKLLARHGYVIVHEIFVATPRHRFGANGHLRVGHETVLIALRRSATVANDFSLVRHMRVDTGAAS